MSKVTVYYLEMTSQDCHCRSETKTASQAEILVKESVVKQAKVNRFMYDLVGEPWQWLDRKTWSIEQWEDYACADNLRTFLGMIDGSIAGYFELKKQGLDTEIAYFGLAPSFTGQGFGGPFLSVAIDHAWRWSSTHRVILNTCTLDHPSALANYKKRGFTVYREVTRALV